MVSRQFGSRARGGARCALGLLGSWVALAACGSGPAPVDEQTLEREEERLIEPFEVDRSVIANELQITMTANFYEKLAVPSMMPGVQEEERSTRGDGGTDYVMRTSDGRDHPLRFELGATKFYIDRVARLTVLGGRQDLTLRAEAHGNVTILEGADRRDVGAVRIENGAFLPEEVQPR